MQKVIGVGKVQNGRMSFITTNGSGFSRPVARPVVEAPVVNEVVETPAFLVRHMEEKAKAALDVPSFMKDRKIEKKGEVIHVDFPQHEEEDAIAEFLINSIDKVSKKVKNNKLVRALDRFFFDGEDFFKGGDK